MKRTKFAGPSFRIQSQCHRAAADRIANSLWVRLVDGTGNEDLYYWRAGSAVDATIRQVSDELRQDR
jgi:hypothetical protein